MKTLDEVIKVLEEKLDIGGEDAVENCLETDALHYLKHLQEYYEMSREHHEPNPALTWSELKQMEGKPVWVESYGDITEFTGWAIVRNALEDRAHFIFSHYDGEFFTYEMALPDVTFGKEWQAYRKEHHD